MPEKKLVNAGGKTAGAYSPALTFGDLVIVSGQIPNDAESSIEEQTKQSLDKIKTQVEAAGCSIDDVLRCDVFLTDMADFPKFNETYAKYFKEPYPTRVTVGISSLIKGFKIEISAIAGKK